MLVESLQDWKRYDFGPLWHEVMTWVEAHTDIADGEYNVAGCTIKVATGTTRPWGAARYEFHRRMADVQVVLQGEEDVYNLPLHTLTTPSAQDAFDEARDLGFFDDTLRLSPVRLVPGIFALLLPWDAHMPSMAVASPATVRKMVVKLPVDKLSL